MIDAYEIGIQLALQDGVSAGLEYISKELAEVDRAIAATSAGYDRLIAKSTESGHAIARSSSTQDKPTSENDGSSSTLTSGAATSAPSAGSADPVTTAVATSVVEHSPVEGRYTSKVLEPVRQDGFGAPTSSPSMAPDGAAPSASRVDVSQVVFQHTASRPADLSPPVKHAVSPDAMDSSPRPITKPMVPAVESGAPSSWPRVTGPQLGVETVATDERRPAVTAEIAKALPFRRADDGIKDRPQLPTTTDIISSERSVSSPSASVAASMPQQSTGGSYSGIRQTAEPGTAQREQGDATTGVVVLDGRLVGYWLSEQMARQAARPPSGTSFFDPRQTPAWSVSGAI